ncbi:MBL fold metallo-hydrolase [Hydrogenivirga sp. 128-5-R1-1]|uniref:MBL fold metallo-hydrolase n=1 Tax=Hydrogenivirga sp. 128-5-R1-1 TaxID=392423 RepID=UPI00015EFA38|nr:MBL fold metallo-hydrolase [Hydrogenivirga sp. 128-5-R1-1]EDP75281.1 beta lactamase precursor [Hydrogenivirga sp. 128-5-R1-1]
MVRSFIVVLFFLSVALGMELQKVGDRIYMAKGGYGLPSKENRGFISNAYGVLTREGWVVIDTLSTPELAREFISELKKVKDAPILYVIVTHYHMDHWFGIAPYKEEGAKFIAHTNLKEFYEDGSADMVLEGAQKSFGVFGSVKLFPPDIVVDSRVKLRVGGDVIEIIPMTPAHTNTDLVIRVGSFYFVGDLVSYKRIPFMGDRNVSTKAWLEVLDRIRKLRPKVLLGGHGDPMDKKAIAWTRDYITFVREEVRRLKDEGLFIDEVKEKLKDSPFKDSKMYEVFHMRNVYSVFNELDMEL